MTRARFDLYLQWSGEGVVKAGECVLEEIDGQLHRFGFRYEPAYLEGAPAIALDPAQLPLARGETILECRHGMPALLDDYLPDAWGQRILARLALVKERRRLNANSAIDMLGLVGPSRIGALLIVPAGAEPVYGVGHPLEDLARAEQLAQRLDDDSYVPASADELDLLYLAHSGTGVGGARPKALFFDDAGYYVAKFNRLAGDDFNNARVELACLRLAARAGIDAADGRTASGINGREVLLLDRFDIAPAQGRYHLITVNGLLKDPGSQQDPGRPFRYDDIHELLVRHSSHVAADLEQLLKLMLFNRCINNTDDHERNFSLINRGDGYRLSPAYDLVPSLTRGDYHAAGFTYQPNPPSPDEVVKLGKVFGLGKSDVRRCADQVKEAMSQWRDIAMEVGVPEADMERIGDRITT